MKYSILILPLLVSCLSNCQTCVIAKKTKGAIYIGADSRVATQTTVNGETTIDTSSVRKIFWCGNAGYAVIGSFGLKAIRVLNKYCNKSANGKSIQVGYQDFFYWLADTLSDLKSSNPKWFDSYIKKWGDALAQLVIFGRESDSFYLYRIKLYYDEPTKKIKFEPSVRTDLMYAGEVDEIKNDLEKPSTWSKGAKEVIKEYIDKAAKYHPIEVGGKTDILKVTSKGITWIKES